MLIRVMNTKVAALSCVLLLAAFSVSNSNAQNRRSAEQNSRDRAQPIDWGSVLDLSPQNTETKRERLDLQKELELGQQIREQNQRSQPDYPGRQDNRSNGTGRGASVAGPQIEIRGVFERDRPDRSNDSDRQYSDRSQGPQRSYTQPARPNGVRNFPGRPVTQNVGNMIVSRDRMLYLQNTDRILLPAKELWSGLARVTVDRIYDILGAARLSLNTPGRSHTKGRLCLTDKRG